MKTTLVALMLAGIAAPALAQTYVQPHINRDGTYVQGHMRSAPDGNVQNNWSTQGNVNPYTGQQGTVNPYQQPSQPSYQPAPIYPPQRQQIDTMRGKAF